MLIGNCRGSVASAEGYVNGPLDALHFVAAWVLADIAAFDTSPRRLIFDDQSR
jgi:hypothetical protein